LKQFKVLIWTLAIIIIPFVFALDAAKGPAYEAVATFDGEQNIAFNQGLAMCVNNVTFVGNISQISSYLKEGTGAFNMTTELWKGTASGPVSRKAVYSNTTQANLSASATWVNATYISGNMSTNGTVSDIFCIVHFCTGGTCPASAGISAVWQENTGNGFGGGSSYYNDGTSSGSWNDNTNRDMSFIVWNGSLYPAPPPAPIPPIQILINLTSEGGLGQIIYQPPSIDNRYTNIARTNDTTPTFRVNTDENANCDITDNRTSNTILCTTTGGVTVHTCTENTIGILGLNNYTINCSDSDGNRNQTLFTINITDTIPPNSSLVKPASGLLFKDTINNTIIFNFSATDNYDRNFSAKLYINNVLMITNNTYINGTNVSYPLIVNTTGFNTWYVNFTDSFNNINQSEIRNFTIDPIGINITLNEYANNTIRYYLDNVQFNFTVNYSENLNRCNFFINGTLNQSNLSLITSNIKYNFTISRLNIRQDYKWNIVCNTSDGLTKNSSYYILSTDPTGLLVSVTTGVNFTFKSSIYNPQSNFPNQTITWTGNNTNIQLIQRNIRNETVLVYNNGTLINQGNNYTIYSTGVISFINASPSGKVGFQSGWVTNKINVSYIFYSGNFTLTTTNISCSGQNWTLGCLNFSVSSPENLNLSLLWNITLDPRTQRIIENWQLSIPNWTTINRSRNVVNQSIINDTIKCAEITSLNDTALVRYRFNNTQSSVYINTSSNSSIPINLTFNCPSITYYTRILNGTQKNVSGFDTFNFTWIGDNTTNQFNITLSDDAGNKLSSPTLSLANNGLNRSGIVLGTLKNITNINISVNNRSSTLSLNTFVLGNLVLINNTQNQSSNIKMKASCTGYYHNATNLSSGTLTNLCVIPANTTTKFIWLFQDINLTKKGVAWKLQYNVSILGG